MNFLDIFFPKICCICGDHGTMLCSNCFKKLIPVDQKCPICHKSALGGITHQKCQTPLSMDGLYASWSYRQPEVRKIIKSIKYKFSQEIVAILLKDNNPYISTVDYLVPIPLHQRRFNWRGFNQAELVAKQISNITNIKVLNLLKRIKYTTPLAGLHITKRADKIIGAFTINKETSPVPEKIILIDDVFTSGSTMSEATRTLKQFGVKQVYGWTLAS